LKVRALLLTSIVVASPDECTAPPRTRLWISSSVSCCSVASTSLSIRCLASSSISTSFSSSSTSFRRSLRSSTWPRSSFATFPSRASIAAASAAWKAMRNRISHAGKRSPGGTERGFSLPLTFSGPRRLTCWVAAPGWPLEITNLEEGVAKVGCILGD
jgi:hypothetical protein